MIEVAIVLVVMAIIGYIIWAGDEIYRDDDE
jgi:nitrogen fixation-related uncharacterized protein